MNEIFAQECFDMIFKFLPTNKDLHSCLLVNKRWTTSAVPIFMGSAFKINDKSTKVIQTYLAFIPDSTFLNLGYNRRIGLSINRPLFFNYPSFLKELSYDQFVNAAIVNNCCKDIIIELFKILAMNNVRLRKFIFYSCLNRHRFGNLDKIESLAFLYFSERSNFSECISIFNSLTYFNYSYQWPVQKTQLFNAIAEYCHNIENLKVSICNKDEGIALAALIRSQKYLKKFTLINSNNFVLFPVQTLESQKHSLKCVAFEDMHCNSHLSKTSFFNYAIFQLNSSTINLLAQYSNINKMKFKHCEGLNSSVFLPLATAFSSLTSLEYSYGAYNIYDNTTPIELLSGLIMTSCNTLKRVILDWHSRDDLDITQLVNIIS
ncbi:3149_t:CDS:1 [Gigaspora margarita]|uniref:3149_t:CDS:1 n=1 Tax=Gigaspora margarita TaxID=4874 RepID=A0ABN7V161_GIGMA|nr:3149_t:CDS:1 [Gigaspora margarita]